jgi:hypothetical protein
MTEDDLKKGLAHYIEAIGRLPPSSLGTKGRNIRAFRMGVYVEGVDEDTGRIYVADPAEVALGRLAWREWVTVRGGQAGGSQAVKPGSGNLLGGFGVAGLIGMLTGVPVSTALGSAPPPESEGEKALQEMLIRYLQNKASTR